MNRYRQKTALYYHVVCETCERLERYTRTDFKAVELAIDEQLTLHYAFACKACHNTNHLTPSQLDASHKTKF